MATHDTEATPADTTANAAVASIRETLRQRLCGFDDDGTTTVRVELLGSLDEIAADVAANLGLVLDHEIIDTDHQLHWSPDSGGAFCSCTKWTITAFDNPAGQAYVHSAFDQHTISVLRARLARAHALAGAWAENDARDPAYALWLMAAIGDADADATENGLAAKLARLVGAYDEEPHSDECGMGACVRCVVDEFAALVRTGH